MQDRAGIIAAFLASQEQRGIRNIDRLTDLAQWNSIDEALHETGRLLDIGGHRRVDEARSDRVDGDLARRELNRKHLAQHPYPRLAHRVLAGTGSWQLGRARCDIDDAPALTRLHHLERDRPIA